MKENLVFLSPPENLRELFSDGAHNEFKIDVDIPVPIDLSLFDAADEADITENLSMETILLSMLRAIEQRQVKQEWIDYYSHFILAVRPDITAELEKFRNSELNNKNYIAAHNLLKEEKAEEALNHIRSFLELHPLVWNGWFLLGWALRLLGRWQDAGAALKKTIELGGDNSDTRNELAICLMESGDMKGAKNELEAALQKDPENIKLISNLGVLALKTGKKEEAIAFFKTVLEIDKDDLIAKKFLEQQLPSSSSVPP